MEKGAALAFFDFDGTMIPGDSIVPFLYFAWRRGDMGLFALLQACGKGLRFKMGFGSGGEMKRAAFSFYQELDAEKRQALDKAFAEKIVKKVYSKARATLSMHKKAGRRAVLVSASTENYMRYVAEMLGVDGLLCTPVDEDGHVGENCHGAEKVRRIEAWMAAQKLPVDLSASYAYGDSRGDLPMLRLCGHGTLVNAKASLKKAAPDLMTEEW